MGVWAKKRRLTRKLKLYLEITRAEIIDIAAGGGGSGEVKSQSSRSQKVSKCDVGGNSHRPHGVKEIAYIQIH